MRGGPGHSDNSDEHRRGIDKEAPVPLSLLLQNSIDPLHRHHEQPEDPRAQGTRGVLQRPEGQGEIEADGLDHRRRKSSLPPVGDQREPQHRPYSRGHSQLEASAGPSLRTAAASPVSVLLDFFLTEASSDFYPYNCGGCRVQDPDWTHQQGSHYYLVEEQASH